MRSNRRPSRPVRALGGALAAAALVLAAAVPGAASASAAPLPQDCKAQQGGALTSVPWPQTRLNFQQVWPITEGRSVATGKPVVVAVIDSGMDTRHPQLRRIYSPTAYDVVDPTLATDRTDCVGHGTGVVSIIAAQPDPAHPQFVGVAPQVQIVPIKQTNAATGSQDAIVRGIDQAITVHAQVANISIGVTNAQPALLAAVRRAAAAGMVIVASAGNDGQSTNLPEYPAAYAPQEPNVIAVSASDQSDGVPNFSVRGNYVTVAAPGQAVTVAGQVSGFFPDVSGTSFASPFVTGTVALMIAAHPGITPQQVRDRIESTADTPPADSLPDPRYGWGIVNPYLAVTDVHTAAQPTPTRATATPLPARAVPPPPDRSLEHLAIGLTLGLIGLSVVLAAGAAVFRGRRRPVTG